MEMALLVPIANDIVLLLLIAIADDALLMLAPITDDVMLASASSVGYWPSV
jgi:hypothetical protein